jgi:hypothetical protein
MRAFRVANRVGRAGGRNEVGENSGLGQDKRTGTFWSHVIDGVEEFPEPATGYGFLIDPFSYCDQGLRRDLSPTAGS